MRVKRKKKIVIVKNNRLKEYGNEEGGKIQINVAKHRGDKSELADTIKHELNHAKAPRASEKTIQKKTKVDMSKMSYAEKEALTKKLRMKTLNYKLGAVKRRFKIHRHEKVERGDLINRMNESKVQKKTNPAKPSNFKLGVEVLL